MYSPTPQDSVTSAVGPRSIGGKFTFGRGGNQGGEGNDAAGEWFVEGLFAELDAPNEFYYNSSSQQLFFYYNGTDKSPPADFVVPSLANLIELQGTQDFPVVNVSISHLNLTANRPTFLEPRGNPSGGDCKIL